MPPSGTSTPLEPTAEPTEEPTAEPTEPTAEPTEEPTAEPTEPTTEPTEPTGACEPTTFSTGGGGTVPVTINNECLAPLFYDFNPNGGDPFWHIHTQQDDTFISLELYTVYGPSWDGDTGTFPLDCNQPWGLCLLFDPDGTGPAPIVMWGSGSITIDRLDEGGYDVTFNGTMPPSPGGIVYDIQPTTWAG